MSTLDDFGVEVPEAETLYDPKLETQYDTGERKLNNARRRLVEEDKLDRREKRVLHQFDRELRNLNNREDRHRKVTQALHIDLTRIIQRDSGQLIDILDDSFDGKDALDELLDRIQSQGYANNYIHNQLITVQTFGELLGSEIVQGRVDEIKPGKFRDDDTTPLPGNVLEWQEAIEMAETRSHTRDKALILSEWGMGSRPDSELLWLQYKHLEWHDGHYRVTIPWDGKTGERTIRLFAGSAILRQWIEKDHPVHADPESQLGPETYLWAKLNANERMEYDNLYRIFKDAGDDAGISKDTNPQHFRRSRASFLAGKPSVSEAELRKYFGWSYESNSPKHYIAKFRQDIDRNIAAADGANINVFEKQQKVAPIECDACGQWTERYVTDCVCCGAEVDDERHEAHVDATMAGAETDLLSMILEGEVGPGDLRSVKKLWGVISDRPKLGQELDTLIEKTERMVDDGKTNAVGGLGGLAGRVIGVGIEAGHRAAAAWAKTKHKAMSLDSQMEHYPPGPGHAAVIGTGFVAYLAIVVAYMSSIGMLEPLLAGEWTSQLGLVLGVGLGFVLITQAMPNLEEVEA